MPGRKRKTAIYLDTCSKKAYTLYIFSLLSKTGNYSTLFNYVIIIDIHRAYAMEISNISGLEVPYSINTVSCYGGRAR